ncbi:MAG TPA: LysR family transcriptional regulator [Mycobacteriales bacterium]
MQLRQLEYFVAVVEESNFTRAADRVHVSQSGVSAQIRQLERELGQVLLDRSERAVRPTHAGAALLPYARAALAAVSGARQAVDELTGLIRGRVAVGMVMACSVTHLFDQLASFHTAHPGVDIALSEDNSDRLLDAVQAGRLDLALVGLAAPPPDGIGSRLIAEEPLVAAVTADDPLGGRTVVTLADLRDRAVVSMPSGTGVRTAFDNACVVAGVSPRVALEASAPDAVVRLALRGLGVAILTRSMIPADDAGLRAVPIEAAPCARLDLVWRTGAQTNPAARALIGHARNWSPTQPG